MSGIMVAIVLSKVAEARSTDLIVPKHTSEHLCEDVFFDALDTSYLPGGGKWHPGALMISLLWPETIQALSISAAEIAQH